MYVHCRHVVLVHIEHRIQFARIKGVAVVVLIGHGEVEGLHGVPTQRIGVHLEDHALDRRAGLDVVQQNGSVRGCSCEHVRLDGIELDRGDGLDVKVVGLREGIPLEGLDGLAVMVFPQLQHGPAARHELRGLALVIDAAERVLAEIGHHGHRGLELILATRVQRQVVLGRVVPHPDRLVLAARQDELVLFVVGDV